MGEVLTIQDAAKILKVSEGTVRRMLDRGELKGVRVGRLWRIPQTEVDRFSQVKQENENVNIGSNGKRPAGTGLLGE